MEGIYKGFQYRIIFDQNVKAYRAYIAPEDCGKNFGRWYETESSYSLEGIKKLTMDKIDRYFVTGIITFF